MNSASQRFASDSAASDIDGNVEVGISVNETFCALDTNRLCRDDERTTGGPRKRQPSGTNTRRWRIGEEASKPVRTLHP